MSRNRTWPTSTAEQAKTLALPFPSLRCCPPLEFASRYRLLAIADMKLRARQVLRSTLDLLGVGRRDSGAPGGDPCDETICAPFICHSASVPVFHNLLAVITSTKNPLARRMRRFELAELRNEPWLLSPLTAISGYRPRCSAPLVLSPLAGS